MNKVTLFEEYRLIERCESEVNGAWRSAHLLLFFLAFVFGSFCTFCFHMLMYLFDEKCVLFPKLMSLTSMRHNVIYEFIPNNKDTPDLPVDFLSTQWIEKNACTLPTYVPLLSGIFGLVWTTMFLMCSTGSRTLTGLQRTWRVLPPVFLFSLAMGSLCVYSSAVTHYGLQELCYKLGEITGSSTCTYTVNVATLAYERRIRGVYQATRLTILTAWLHTACWILSALLALARVLLAVDFQLVRINVELRGDIDKMLQKHEQQIRTVSPEPGIWIQDEYVPSPSRSITKVHFRRKKYHTRQPSKLVIKDESVELNKEPSDTLFFSKTGVHASELSLVPAERKKLARRKASIGIPKDERYIVDMLHDLVDSIGREDSASETDQVIDTSSSSHLESESGSNIILRQMGRQKIPDMNKKETTSEEPVMSLSEAELIASEVRRMLQKKLDMRLLQSIDSRPSQPLPTGETPQFTSMLDMTEDLKKLLKAIDSQNEVQPVREDTDEDNKVKHERKSNLKSVGVQTVKSKAKVKISKSAEIFTIESEPNIQTETSDGTSDGTYDKPLDKQKKNKENVVKLDNDEIVVIKAYSDEDITMKERPYEVIKKKDISGQAATEQVTSRAVASVIKEATYTTGHPDEIAQSDEVSTGRVCTKETRFQNPDADEASTSNIDNFEDATPEDIQLKVEKINVQLHDEESKDNENKNIVEKTFSKEDAALKENNDKQIKNNEAYKYDTDIKEDQDKAEARAGTSGINKKTQTKPKEKQD